jgi:DNA-nicking Smr family endonuclease
VLDLHGFSLDEANKEVKKFIIKYSNNGFKKILVITGKGLRSKSQSNPYISEELSVLKNSVPNYIKSNEILSNKIKSISLAEIKDGGKGAIYIYLRKSKKIKE